MLKLNQTLVTGFLLLGFRTTQILNPVLFLLFSVTYILSLVGNLLIIILVAMFQSLKSPMYIFIAQLSLCDILHTTNIVPNMLHVVINGGSTISVTGCTIQFYFFATSVGTECLLLTVMSYDRYLAICHPLHYTATMHIGLCLQLIIWSWLWPFVFSLILCLLIYNLQFCGPNIIDHYFCDLAPLLEMACSDLMITEMFEVAMVFLFVLLPFFFILFTYVAIFMNIIGISSNVGMQKFFSTCTSHLIIVSMYYGTLTIVYIVPTKGSFNVNKVISLLYTIGNPFFNPIVYSLRNLDIKIALMKFMSCNQE